MSDYSRRESRSRAGFVAVPIDHTELLNPDRSQPTRQRVLTGAEFLLDEVASPPPIWGENNDVLWAAGEGISICGSDGTGKSTLAQQLALARLGLRTHVLGYPVRADLDGNVLYLAMDRPEQIKRSFRRMITEADRSTLAERLIIYRGPLEFPVLSDPAALADLAEQHMASTVIIDSLKDMTPNPLTDDTVGQAMNIVYQELIARRIESLILHHPRKANGENKKPLKLDDYYGSRWLRSGLGSVFMLWATQAGSTRVEMHHAKPVMEPVGPLYIEHDHPTGQSTVAASPGSDFRTTEDALISALLASGSEGLTLAEAADAIALAGSATRYRLTKLVESDVARYEKGTSGGTDPRGKAGRWFAIIGGNDV